MKVKKLIEELSKLDPELTVVTVINKYNTHREANTVETGTYDEVSGTFNSDECYDDEDYAPDAVSIRY